jgi:thiol-disulfide isomerase/thioredoxin
MRVSSFSSHLSSFVANRLVFSLTLLALLGSAVSAQGTPTVKQALQFAPIQADVDYDRPTEAIGQSCTIKAEKEGGQTSWVVRDASGQVLRRFTDTNGDNVVDQWSYFKGGLETYRDIDANQNGKADQYRWFHTSGTRWGMDRDEDGKIDLWRTISAEEVAFEVVAALKARDERRFANILISADDLKSLGLDPAHAKQLSEKGAAARDGFRAMADKQKTISKQTKFIEFASGGPGIVPAGTQGISQDLTVYEGVTALVETAGKHDQFMLGTLIRVADTWRLIDIPAFESGSESGSGGYFFQVSVTAEPDRPGEATSGPSENTQRLMAEIEKLDRELNSAAANDQANLHAQRADVLEQLADEAKDPGDRAQWIRQLADTVGVAVQSGAYPGGAQRLETLENKLKSQNADEELQAYVNFRRMSSAYGQSLQSPDANFNEIQTQWLKDLEAFVTQHPRSPDTAEALLQLAIAQEFAGKDKEAIEWYGRIVSEFSSSAPAKKAGGAKRRLESIGKGISLRGQNLQGKVVDLAKYRGKTVLIQYWATWCEPCKTDMAQIKELLAKNAQRNFAVIGVNLDSSRDEVARFLKSNRLPWEQIYEPGGLDSRLANELGILTLPTMLLVDEKGNVANRNVHVTELDGELSRLLPER